MGILKLKGCPRCEDGALVLDRDYYGWYEYCIQCGYMHDVKSMVDFGKHEYCSVQVRDKKLLTLSKSK